MTTDNIIKEKGFRTFLLIWTGQLFSIFGSAVTSFGLTIWAYEKTQQATPLALVGLFFMIPMVLLSPISGALVDRFDRKMMMIVSDLSSALMTLTILLLHSTNRLEIWHIYLTALVIGIFNGFQWPAYSAVISTMLPKQYFARAAALMETAGTASGILGPILAASLIGIIQLQGLFILDLTTATIAIVILLLIKIPQPVLSTEGASQKGNSIIQDAIWGAKFVLQRPSLVYLQTIFTLGNLFHGLAGPISAAMILARTSQNVTALGIVNSAGAIGGLAGGLLMGIWGGPKTRVKGVLGGWLGAGLFGGIMVGLSSSVPTWAAAFAISSVFFMVVNGSNQALWQSKVPPDVQGRVFGIRRLIAMGVSPIGFAISGPLADKVFEPAMNTPGRFQQLFAPLVGTGPGSGMSLMFIISGLLIVITVLIGFTLPKLTQVEKLIPDFDEIEPVIEQESDSPTQEII